MKSFAGLLLAIGLCTITIVSALTMSSCRDKFTTQYDTLVKHDTLVKKDTMRDTLDTCPDDTAWTNRVSGTKENLVIGQFVNSTSGFVAGSNGVFLASADTGHTWSLMTAAPVYQPSSGPGAIYGISFFDASNGFAVGEQRDIDQTNDGGMTWNMMNTNNVPQTDLIRSVYFTSRNTGFVGTTDAFAAHSGSICGTVDGGQTWNPVTTTNGGIYNIDFNIPSSGGMKGVAIGRYGVAYWTVDGGGTWNQGSTDQPNSLIARTTFTTATTGFAVAFALADTIHGYILRTDDAGHTWHTVKSVALALDGIASNGNGTITAVGFGGAIVESTDGGATWSQSNFGMSRWSDIRYATQHRAVLFGANGNIATRDK
jgi:photosystem II stability/assembly factor-like uncharacterized protein